MTNWAGWSTRQTTLAIGCERNTQWKSPKLMMSAAICWVYLPEDQSLGREERAAPPISAHHQPRLRDNCPTQTRCHHCRLASRWPKLPHPQREPKIPARRVPEVLLVQVLRTTWHRAVVPPHRQKVIPLELLVGHKVCIVWRVKHCHRRHTIGTIDPSILTYLGLPSMSCIILHLPPVET